MWARCLRFVLLVWFPGVLHGQSAALPCPAPTLNGGYFVPENETYAHETKLTYACEKGLKPAAEVWWATSTCQNGKWSHEPQCIGSSTTPGSNGRESIPNVMPISYCGAHPVVPNGVVVQAERSFLKYQCNAFYTQVGLDTVVCHSDGSWSELPICKEAFCVLDPANYPGSTILIPAVEYLKEGEGRCP
ncbi:coagulation factor XIII B chain-like [Chelmon rostratus]|uniref:coagulation factor XIII B chain-like n=1 Tax=Chelmon rostratus TaxID=109905 RepID=UPI001BE67A54|nr:coagulation factor XIII B chain-like [Chelmon rostratus]